MIDVKHMKENPALYRENAKRKFKDPKVIDEALRLDEHWRKIKLIADNLRRDRNSISEEINEARKRKDEKKAKELIRKAQEIPKKLEAAESEEKETLKKLEAAIYKVPNIMSKRVPVGKSDLENVEEKKFGKIEKKDFEIKGHAEIAENLGMADFESSARVAGTGFYYLESDLALLNAALINYARDIMVKKGFRYVETPLMLRNEIINKVTDIKDQENMIYRISNDDVSLIGTSEHSLIGRFAGREINEKNLPIKHTSYSMCFRKEIGGHGIDEKGIFRTHQFNKIEMVAICKPEESEKIFEEFKNISTEILKGLEIPFRIIRICSGDLGDLKYEQVDFEVYSPVKGRYLESGSCSNLTDAQARKLGISTRIKGERVVPHTLNNTALATPRPLISIIENNQQKDGSIKIPKVLWKYMGGKKKIEKPKEKQEAKKKQEGKPAHKKRA